jgi:1-acylglycerone phosphate reductase
LRLTSIGYASFFLDVDIEKAKKMFDTNIWGVVGMVQAFAPLLIAAQGTIVNVSSIVAKMGVPTMGPYSASKAALDLLSQTLRYEMTSLGVRTINISTGVIRTNFFDKFTVEMPENSLYLPIKEEIIAGSDKHGLDGMTPSEFSRTVVKQILQPNKPAAIWCGTHCFVTWFAYMFLPWKWADAVYMDATHMSAISKMSHIKDHGNGYKL